MLNFLCRVLMILFLLVIDHRCRGQEFQILVIKTIPPNDLAILFIECSHLENLSLDRSTSSLSKKWLLISLKRSILFSNEYLNLNELVLGEALVESPEKIKIFNVCFLQPFWNHFFQHLNSLRGYGCKAWRMLKLVNMLVKLTDIHNIVNQFLARVLLLCQWWSFGVN